MTRVSTGSYSGTWISKDTDQRTNTTTVNNSGSSAAFSRTVSRSEIVKSANRKQVPLRPLPYSCSVSEIKYISGYLRFRLTSQTYREYAGSSLIGLVATNSLPPSVTIQQATRDAAVTKLLQNIKDQDINLAQAFAEAKMTVALVADTAVTIAGAVRDCRHGKFADAARKLGIFPKRWNRRKPPHDKEAHQAWLEMKYGWEPLLSDVYGAAKAFADSNTENPERLWVKVQSQVKRQDHGEETHGSGVTFYRLREDREEIVRFIVYMKQNNPTLATQASLGFTNPVLLAWELLPWSFVVDWFLPIGDYLGTLDATLGWQFICGCRCEIATAKRYNPKWAGTHSTFMAGQLQGGSRQYNFNRIVLGAFPSARLPRLKNPVSTVHLANALALLRGAFS